MGLFTLPNPAGTRALPSGLLELDSRSNTFVVPGEYEMPVPATDAAAVALGWPSLAAAVDGDMWLCDEAAGSLIGKVRGYQLAPQNAPLQNRDFHGLPYGGNLWAKKAVETLGNSGNDRFTAAAGAGVLDIGAGVDFTISLLLRPRSVAPAVAEEFVRKLLGVTGWDIYCGVAGQPVIRWNDGGWFSSTLAVNVYDGALHLLTASSDRDGNFSWYLDGNATVAVAATRPGDLTNGDIFALLNYGTAGGNAFNGQCAWAWFCIGVAANRTGHDAMWARLSSSNLGTANTYARTNPLTVPISASRVATYGAGQVAIGYNANAVAADNALGTGVVAEDGASFLGLGSNNLATWPQGFGGYVFVGHDGAVVDLKKYVAADGTLAATYATPAGRRAWCGCFDGTSIWVCTALPAGNNQVYQIRPSDGAILNTITPAGVGTPTGICSDGTYIYIAWQLAASSTLYQYTLAGAAGWTQAGLGVGAYRPCYDSSTAHIWVPISNANVISKVKIADGSITGSYATNATPTGCCFDGTNIWVTSEGAAFLRKLTAATGALVGDYATDARPETCCFDGTYVYAACYNTGRVTKIRASDGAVIATYDTGAGANNLWDITSAFDGKHLWLTLRATNTVMKMRVSDGQRVGSYATSATPICAIVANRRLPWPAGGVADTYGTVVDGPSGMRDAINVADASASEINYVESLAATITGASNVAFRFGFACQQVAAGGTNAVAVGYFLGDANGAEYLTVATLAGTVPAAWGRFGGSVTPTRAGQTTVALRVYPTDAAVASTGTVAFAEPWGVQGSSVDRLAWRRCATGAASATSTPTLSYTNVANARYSPARGRLRVRVANFQGTSGAFFFTFGAAGTAGAMTLSYNAGALILRIWDDVAALVCTLSCGAVNTADHTYTVEWDAALGKAAVFEGAAVLDSFGGTWTPEPLAVAPLYVGCDNLGTSAARCLIELLTGYDF